MYVVTSNWVFFKVICLQQVISKFVYLYWFQSYTTPWWGLYQWKGCKAAWDPPPPPCLPMPLYSYIPSWTGFFYVYEGVCVIRCVCMCVCVDLLLYLGIGMLMLLFVDINEINT